MDRPTLAVWCPNWVGDLVMCTPALAALRRHFASWRIVGIVRRRLAGLLEGASWFDTTWCTEDRALWHPAWELRRYRPRLAVLFTHSLRTALMARLASCRRIVGYRRDGRACLLTDRLDFRRDAKGKRLPSPVIDDYNRLAQYLGCPWPGYRMILYTTALHKAEAHKLWDSWRWPPDAPVVGFNPHAAYGPAKKWPLEYFVQLAQLLLQDPALRILVLCGPGEEAESQKLVHCLRSSRVQSLAGATLSLGLTKACIERLTLLITTDSGPRHIAACFDRPVITLFGPTHKDWTETYYPKAVHLQREVPCGPCQLRRCPLDHACMRMLTPDQVYSVARAILDRASTPREVGYAA
ncbi:MAG: ADP-heptose--LPS heptosyltransferase [Gemmataceae bacterium]